jgi:hypothetical protein
MRIAANTDSLMQFGSWPLLHQKGKREALLPRGKGNGIINEIDTVARCRTGSAWAVFEHAEVKVGEFSKNEIRDRLLYYCNATKNDVVQE